MKTGRILLVILAVSMFLASCTKVSEEIIGTWTYQTLDTQEQGVVNWTFKEDGSLIRVMTTDSGIKIDSCNYVVDKSLLKTQLTISGSEDLTGYSSINGVFRIDDMTDDVLKITRIRMSDDEVEGAYLRCELLRKL